MFEELLVTKYTPVNRGHCLAIFKSNLTVFFAPEEEAEFIDWLDNETDDNYFVVEAEGRIIACGGIYADPDKGYSWLTWGMVHRDLHHQGIGSWFARYRIDKLRQGNPDFVVRIDTSQHTAPFYEKIGFACTEIISNGYGQGFDQYHMQLVP